MPRINTVVRIGVKNNRNIKSINNNQRQVFFFLGLEIGDGWS